MFNQWATGTQFSVRITFVWGFKSHGWNGKAGSPITRGRIATSTTLCPIISGIKLCPFNFSQSSVDWKIMASWELPGKLQLSQNKSLSWVYHSHQHHGRAVFEIVVLFTCSTPWKALSYNLVYSWSTQSRHFHDSVVIIVSSKLINANSKSTLRCYGVFIYCLAFQVALDSAQYVFLNRSSVHGFHTISHQPLLFLGKCRQDHRSTVSIAIFWLSENSKSPVKDNRRIIRLQRCATYICKLSENIFLRW